METETQTKTLPKFKGKPLIENPETIPFADFLEGDFGKAFLEEYKRRVISDYNNNSVLNVLDYDRGIVKCSNSYAVILSNQILNQEGLRTATQADLEKILKTNALDLRGTYEDSGLVLRTEDNPNEYLAKDLMKQIKSRNPKAKMPQMINLCDLYLIKDSNSPNGLVFKLKEDANLIYAQILNEQGKFYSEDIDEKTGLPKKISDNGDRTLYTGNSGLSRLYLYGLLSLVSDWDVLQFSGGDGRVVAVRGEATPKNFEKEVINEINQEYKKQLDILNKKRDKALSIIKE